MILYDLVCDKDHSFEAWFRNSSAADKVLKAGQSPCPHCGSAKVRKAPMAPRLGKTIVEAPVPAEQSTAPAQQPAAEVIPPGKRSSGDLAAAMEKATQALQELRTTIEKKFENVGERFPEEARRIHYGESPERGIFGDATLEEARELIEEGIKVAAIPWPRRRN